MSGIILEGITATVIGMGIVFAVLAVIAFVLGFFKFLSPAPPVGAVNEDEDESADYDEIESDEVTENESFIGESSDSEIVAVISAAVAAYLGTDVENTVIRSIKPVTHANTVRNSYSPWNMAAKRESHRGLY